MGLIFRSLFALLPLCVPASPAAARTTPIPAVLQPYVQDGQFDPGDFGWMRGRLESDDAAARAAWETVRAYNQACMDDARAAAIAQIDAMGVRAPDLPPGSYGDSVCSQLAIALPIRPATAEERAMLPERMARARQYWDFARAGARLSATTITPHISAAAYDPEDADKDDWFLIQATFDEQFGRRALSWERREENPAVPSELQPFFYFLAGQMVDREDRKNTVWLRALVAGKGWPTISRVGEAASNAAWLLVQHADHDPAFQLEALRLMEPLAKAGEVSKNNYAYLYDRIMLKIAGRQRYATQFSGCEADNPERPLRPMEDADPARIDALRAEMGLGPLADYRAQMDRSFGNCAEAKR